MEHVIRPIEKSELARIISSGEKIPETEYWIYNYFSDYALLAFLLEKEERKKIPTSEVVELKNFMEEELLKVEQSDTTYSNYTHFYSQHTDMLEYSGGNKYLPDHFILREGFSTLDVAKRAVTCFDRRQLSTVLPPEVVNVLLTLLPQEETKKEYVKQ